MTVTQDRVFELKVCAGWLSRRLRAVVLYSQILEIARVSLLYFNFYVLLYFLFLHIFAYKRNEMQWSSFVRDISANDLRHISVKTVEYRSCKILVSSSAPIGC